MIETSEAMNEVQNDTEGTPESVQEAEVQEETQEQTTQAETEQPQEEAPKEPDNGYSQQYQNWKALREKAERAERERDEAIARLKNTNPQSDQQTQQENYDLGDDDLAEGKHLKHYQTKSEARMRQLEEQVIESKLRTAYPDFDKIVNAETLAMLKDADPELTESLAANPNLYSKAVAAYKSIKRYNLSPNSYQKEKEVVKKNTRKPQSATSVNPQKGNSPLARANEFAQKLTPERKRQIRQEMKEIIRNS